MDPQDSDQVISDVHSHEEYMSEPYINPYTISKTIIFWYVEDYPIPIDSDPVSIDKEIRSTLKGADFLGEVSIIAYIDKKILSNELRRKYRDAGITVNSIPEGDTYSRVCPMLVDSYLWAIENASPANMILLAKKVPIRTMIAFQQFYRLGYGVVLSDPNNDWEWLPRDNYWPPRLESSCLFLTSLFDKKQKRKDTDTKEEAIANAQVTLNSQSLSPHRQWLFMSAHTAVESKSRFFSNPNIANMDEDTLLVLVVEDWSNMPKVSELHEAYKKVETALDDEGYDEGFEQRIFIVDPKTDGSFDDCQKEYLKYDFYLETCKGDREARFNHMLLNILSWTFGRTDYSDTSTSERANVVLLSRNENLGKGTKLFQVLDTLFKDGFNVAIVNPDTL